MSTKAIREVLEYMRQHHGSGMMEDAEAELAAIERAAKELIEIWGYARHGMASERVMESIAKEAP